MDLKKEIKEELEIIIEMINSKEEKEKIDEHRTNLDKLLQEYLLKL